jgi:Holliday junction resolvase RusA-like endonuclease
MQAAQQLALPLEFVVLSKPISHQASNKKALGLWKSKVFEAAQAAALGRSPVGCPCLVTITHFFDADEWESGVPDNDNVGLAITKPIRDALNGVIYVDDYQITDFTCRTRSLNGTFRVKGISEPLAEGFRSGKDFLHILVQMAPDQSLL